MRHIVPLFLINFLLLVLLSGHNGYATNLNKQQLAASKLRVLSTIKPIHALVIAIAGKQVESTQLIPDYASPHSYSFKPSDISRIKQADVIFRIDEDFELLLNHAFENKQPNTPLVSLADNKNIQLLKRLGSHHHDVKTEPEKHNKADKHNDHNTHHSPHTQTDLHIWTSPKNMQSLANNIAATLIKLDVKNKTIYEKNLAQLNAQLIKTTKEIETDLVNLKKKPTIVFHYSWQYFSHQFGLRTPVIVDFQEGISAGIKSIKILRKKIRDIKISCLLADPSIKPSRVKTITEGQAVSTEFIDILGADIPLNQNTSVALLKTISSKMAACLR